MRQRACLFACRRPSCYCCRGCCLGLFTEGQWGREGEGKTHRYRCCTRCRDFEPHALLPTAPPCCKPSSKSSCVLRSRCCGRLSHVHFNTAIPVLGDCKKPSSSSSSSSCCCCCCTSSCCCCCTGDVLECWRETVVNQVPVRGGQHGRRRSGKRKECASDTSSFRHHLLQTFSHKSVQLGKCNKWGLDMHPLRGRTSGLARTACILADP